MENITTSNEGINLMQVVSDTGGYKVSPVVEESEVKKNNVLFEILDALFTNRTYIYNMTEQQASQNLFMTLRRLAINYPLQANTFNNGKVNALDVMKFWTDYLYCGKKPAWMYVKGVKATRKENKKLSEKDIKEYLEFYDIDRKDFEFAMKIYNEEAVKDVTDFKKMITKLKENGGEKDIDNE